MKTQSTHHQEGHAILMALILLTLLAALATAQFAVAQKGSQASSFLRDFSALREYADSGLNLALHDLEYNFSGNSGKIGTNGWTTAKDYGRDGVAGTYDEGEGDSAPTPGEPGVVPVSVGPTSLRAALAVYVADTAIADQKRVVAVAANTSAMAKVSAIVRSTKSSVPHVAAMFVDPNVVLDLNGNRFVIDGNDHKLDGTPLSGGAVPGIATDIGSPPGTNESNILAQVPAMNYDQILGLGGFPSIDEQTGVDLTTLFNTFLALKTNTLAAATYTDPVMGTTTTPQVTYASGDLKLSGHGEGAGILLVDGSLTFSGQFSFKGLVIVRGDVRLTGGGAGVHVYGSILVGQSFTAVETDPSDVTLSGTADILYSSEALDMVESRLKASYAVVYWDDQ